MSRLSSWLPWKEGKKGLLGQGLAKQIGNVTECALLGFLLDLGTFPSSPSPPPPFPFLPLSPPPFPSSPSPPSPYLCLHKFTRCCLLAGIDYEPIREAHPTEIFTKVFTFNSARKSMTTVIPLPGGGYRMLSKGASEMVLNKCSFILGENGQVVPLSTDGIRDIVMNVVQPMAAATLRTICLAYR